MLPAFFHAIAHKRFNIEISNRCDSWSFIGNGVLTDQLSAGSPPDWLITRQLCCTVNICKQTLQQIILWNACAHREKACESMITFICHKNKDISKSNLWPVLVHMSVCLCVHINYLVFFGYAAVSHWSQDLSPSQSRSLTSSLDSNPCILENAWKSP